MAINKTAKNIISKVKSQYTLIVNGKLEKTADKINIEAQEGNLTLGSNKKNVLKGDKT